MATKKPATPPSRDDVLERVKKGERVHCCRCGFNMTPRDVSSVWCGTCRGYLCEDCVDQTSQCAATNPSIDVSEFS